MLKQLLLGALVLCTSVGVLTADPGVPYDLMPLIPAADESGFGTLQASLSSPFAALLYSGTINTRVYTDTAATPGNTATFVWEVIVDAESITPIEDVSIAATALQNDLRIMQIVNGVCGYITGTDDPDTAIATNNDFPTPDSVFYEWGAADRLAAGETAVLYAEVTGVTQLGQVSVAIQDGGGANATVFAPVDDPNSPDLTVPEPTTTALLGLGLVALLRRRR